MNMRYHVIPHTVFFTNRGRSTPRISWQVVDVDAGINERAYPRKLVASCRDEGQARSIADHFNGVNSSAEYWHAQNNENSAAWQGCLDRANRNAAEAREAADSLRKLLDAAIGERDAILDGSYSASLKSERDRLRAQLFEAREAADSLRKLLDAAIAQRDMAQRNDATGADILKDTLQERDRLRAQLFEAREQRDTAREMEIAFKEQAHLDRGSSEANGAEAERAREELRIVRAALNALQSALQSPLGDGRITMPLNAYNILVYERNHAEAKAATLEKELLELQPLHTYINNRWTKTT